MFALLLGLVSLGFCFAITTLVVASSGHGMGSVLHRDQWARAFHKTLCPNKSLNEGVEVIGQAMIGVNFTAYRLQHIVTQCSRMKQLMSHIWGIRQQPG